MSRPLTRPRQIHRPKLRREAALNEVLFNESMKTRMRNEILSALGCAAYEFFRRTLSPADFQKHFLSKVPPPRPGINGTKIKSSDQLFNIVSDPGRQIIGVNGIGVPEPVPLNEIIEMLFFNPDILNGRPQRCYAWNAAQLNKPEALVSCANDLIATMRASGDVTIHEENGKTFVMITEQGMKKFLANQEIQARLRIFDSPHPYF